MNDIRRTSKNAYSVTLTRDQREDKAYRLNKRQLNKYYQ